MTTTILIPYVDGSDREWRKDHDATGRFYEPERYRSWGTLRYLLRSYAENIPWADVALIVARESQVPDWYTGRVILHSDFIPEEHLPTFQARSLDKKMTPMPRGRNHEQLYHKQDSEQMGALMDKDPWVMRECVKEWLTDVGAAYFEQRELEERIARKRAALERMGCPLDGRDSVTGGLSSGMEEGIAQYLEWCEQWNETITDNSFTLAIAYELCPVRHIERYVCFLHWVEGFTWSQVANKVGYSETYVKKEMCDSGCAALYPLMPEKYRRHTFPDAMD